MTRAHSIRFLLFLTFFVGFQLYVTADVFDPQSKHRIGIGIDTAKAKVQPPQDKTIKEVPKSKRKSRPEEVGKEEQKEATEKVEKTEQPEKKERPEVKRPEVKERPESANGKGNGKNQ